MKLHHYNHNEHAYDCLNHFYLIHHAYGYMLGLLASDILNIFHILGTDTDDIWTKIETLQWIL
jgi:hypothetical protein